MNVKQFKDLLASNPDKALHIMLPDGALVPEHFHITEVGRVVKDFVDCGGTKRQEKFCALQVWVASDEWHRLESTKLAKIMSAAESLVEDDLPLMVEYGGETISQYPVSKGVVISKGLLLMLGCKPTCCLAPDKCGVKGCC